MADTVRVGIMGAGWPGQAHAKGYDASGGFKIVAVADLIPGLHRRPELRDTASQALLIALGIGTIALAGSLLSH